jgi:hypothetical protein
MSFVAAFLAVIGVGMMIFAALATEPEDIWRRAILGIAGLLLLTYGVYLI